MSVDVDVAWKDLSVLEAMAVEALGYLCIRLLPCAGLVATYNQSSFGYFDNFFLLGLLALFLLECFDFVADALLLANQPVQFRPKSVNLGPSNKCFGLPFS